MCFAAGLGGAKHVHSSGVHARQGIIRVAETETKPQMTID